MRARVHEAVLLLSLAAALPAEDRTIPRPTENRGQWQGRIVAVENREADGGVVEPPRFWLQSGKEILWLHPLQAIHLSPGDQVAAQGVRFGDELSASVSRIAAFRGCSTSGDIKAAVVLFEMINSRMANVISLNDIRECVFSTSGRSVAGHWRESSAGAAKITGDVLGPFPLQQDFVTTNVAAVLPDLVRAAGSAVAWQQYNQLYLLVAQPAAAGSMSLIYAGCQNTPAELSSRGFSGAISILGLSGSWSRETLLKKLLQSYATLGLGSADSLDSAPFALGPPGAAGTLQSRGDPFSPLGGAAGHLAAPHKAAIDWLTTGRDLQEVQSAGSYRIVPAEDQGAGAKALRIRRSQQSGKWIWLEFRQPQGYDQDLLAVTSHVFSGVLGHYEDSSEPTYLDRSVLIDFNPPATKYNYRDFRDSALVAGKSWSDPFGPLTLRADSVSAAGATVNVNYDASCAALGSTGASHGSGAETGTIAVTAPSTCQWTVVAVADWITITSAASGSGNAIVTYSLAANGTQNARTAGIFIARQEFSVTQAASYVELPPSAAAVTPATGSGYKQTLQFTITDPNGADDIDVVDVEFLGPAGRGCLLMVRPQYKLIYLLTENSMWLAPQAVGASDNLQQSVCGVDVSKTSLTSGGNDLKFTLPMVFSPQIGGRVTAKIDATDKASKHARFILGD